MPAGDPEGIEAMFYDVAKGCGAIMLVVIAIVAAAIWQVARAA